MARKKDRGEGGDRGPARELAAMVMLLAQAVHKVTGAGAVQEKSGITVRQVQALMALTMAGAMSMGELGKSLGIAPSTATELADRLVASGLAKRIEKPGDRRTRLLRPTRKGRTGVEKFRKSAERGMEMWLAHVGDRDRKALLEAFRTILRIMES
jgi:DNA-binding MarR family transcriptional regulator